MTAYDKALKVGGISTTILAVAAVWIMFDLPTPATSTRVDGVDASQLETKILLLEDKVDRLAIRKGKFDGIARTESIVEQVQRIERQQIRFQRKLDLTVKELEELE